MTDGARRTRREGLSELAEDAVGFGGQELRLTRDLILRPRAVMDAYDAHGSTAGGLYPKPLRYWLTVNGLYLLFMALTGSFERATRRDGFADEGYAFVARKAGKSLDEFMADMEQWTSLVSLPLYALIIGGAIFLLIRRWNPGNDRQDFRQTFTLLNTLTLWTIPISVVSSLFAPAMVNFAVAMFVFPLLIAVLYAVLGKGRWWRTPAGAWGKGVLLSVAALLAIVPYAFIGGTIAVAGAFFLP